jgi:hypothetical protein
MLGGAPCRIGDGMVDFGVAGNGCDPQWHHPLLRTNGRQQLRQISLTQAELRSRQTVLRSPWPWQNGSQMQ